MAAEHVPVDAKNRVDLRELPLFTIDGASAKDLDDAVSLSFDGTYFHLGVHIADVSAMSLREVRWTVKRSAVGQVFIMRTACPDAA